MIPTPHPNTVAALQRRLRAWFGDRGRDLPWRRRRSLYGTWIAEMMLQQTTVVAVVPYWERFLSRFPDVESLAAADLQEVLAHWSGLGYYRRARQLHGAARMVMDTGGGRLPRDREGWLALPGVGPYAAGAIASMGLGEAVPAVDANARRVLLRWFTADPGEAATAGQDRIQEMAARVVPAQGAGEWNEAVMELGALVCRARNPACGDCPVRTVCRAGRAGVASEVPPPANRVRPTSVTVTALVATDGARILLVPAADQPVLRIRAWGEAERMDLSGLHRGLWGPPGSAWYGADCPAAEATGAWRSWLGQNGIADSLPALAGNVRHTITRWRLEVVVARVELSPAELERLAGDLGGHAWGPDQEVPISRLAAKIIDR